jgi:hypothetical protein
MILTVRVEKNQKSGPSPLRCLKSKTWYSPCVRIVFTRWRTWQFDKLTRHCFRSIIVPEWIVFQPEVIL